MILSSFSRTMTLLPVIFSLFGSALLKASPLDSLNSDPTAWKFDSMPDSIRNAQSISSTDERTPDQSDVLAFHYSLTAPKDPCFVVFSPAQDQYQFAVSPGQTLVLWVKGDGSGCHLHVSIVAADGLVHQWTVGYVNWVDWRKIEIKLTPGGDGYDVWGPSHLDAHEAHPIIAPAKFNALSIERQDPHFPTGMLLIGGIGLESGQ